MAAKIKTNPLLSLVLLSCAIGAAPAAPAQEPADAKAPLDPKLAWKEVSAVRLDVEFPGDGYHASWLVHRCRCGDLLVESELNLPGEVEKGELLLVGQRAVLVRGFKSKELETESSWDAPALMMQLALQLLERTAPEGPGSIFQRTLVSIREDEEAIQLDSGNAIGGFPAPWTVNGMVEPLEPSLRRFDLQFTFTPPAPPGEAQEAKMRLKGLADYARRDFPLPDNMPLDDWGVNWRRRDDPAREAGEVETLGALRALITTHP